MNLRNYSIARMAKPLIDISRASVASQHNDVKEMLVPGFETHNSER